MLRKLETEKTVQLTKDEQSKVFGGGDIFSGFDYKKIKKINKEWYGEILSLRCWECDAWWACNACLANRYTANSFLIKREECRSFVETSKKSFREYLEILEEEDANENNNCYTDIDSYIKSL
jgi:hypothetical protein